MKKKKPPKVIEYNPVCEPDRMHGYRGVRWVENVSDGLRLVGYADEIARTEGRWRLIDHKGWYTDDDGSNGQTLRGVVYQLPARRGQKLAQYVYGYADPNNDDCALLCFEEPTGEVMRAALAADHFAERFAEAERAYDEAWQAGRRYEDLADQIKDTREQALKLGAEMRAAKKLGVAAPTICAVLRVKIASLYEAIQKMRKERRELQSSFGRCEGWAE